MRSTTAVPANHWNRRREGPTFQILGFDCAEEPDRELADRDLPERELPDRELPDRELADRELPDRELPERTDPLLAREREFVRERLREPDERVAVRPRLWVGVRLVTRARLIADLR